MKKTIHTAPLRSCVALAAAATLFMPGCGSLRGVMEHEPQVELWLPGRQAAPDTDGPLADTASGPRIITYRREDGTELQLIPRELASKDSSGMLSLNIDRVVITSKNRFRNTAERNGKIHLEFCISVPRKLQHRDWRLVATPCLLKGSDTVRLDPVAITGDRFRAMQEAEYDAWNRYSATIVDSADYFSRFGNEQRYNRWVEKVQSQYDQLSGLDRYLRDVAVEEAMFDPEVGWTTMAERRSQYAELRRYVLRTEGRMRRLEAGYELSPRPKGAREGIGMIDYRELHALALRHRRTTHVADPMIDKILRETSDSADNSNFRVRSMVIWQMRHKLAGTDRDAMRNDLSMLDRRSYERNLRRRQKSEWVFARKVRHPWIDPARLDTVISRAADRLDYRYEEVIEADENTSKLFLFLDTRIEDAVRDYPVACPDTLTFNIASMTAFIDPATRYMQRIVLRDAEANARFFFTFPQGRAELADTVLENRRQILAVRDLTRRLMTDPVFVIDSITLRATSSPEGAWELNERLSKDRAEALREVLVSEFRLLHDSLAISASYAFDAATGQTVLTGGGDDLPDLPSLLRTAYLAEDWESLLRMAAADEELPDRDEVLEALDTGSDPDLREQRIRTRYPKAYAYLSERIYPRLRAVDFRFALHRRGQLQDTVYTTVVDSSYMRGAELLRKRRYKESLDLLRPYEDRNTALAYMSLGYDAAALRILSRLDPGGDRAEIQYLLAILHARKGDEERAVQHFLRSVELLPRLRFRGNLDPELSVLIARYGLFEE